MREKTYRIGEAADMLRLKSYVLRFWETEFPQLAPLRTDKGQRLYTDYHIALLHRIRQLLHEQGMTIEGARRILASAARTDVTLDALPPYAAAPMPVPSPVLAPAQNAGHAAQPVAPSMPAPFVPAPLMPAPPVQQRAAQHTDGQPAEQMAGHSIDRNVVREMRNELLALRTLLMADE